MPRITREPLSLKIINSAKPKDAPYYLRDATQPGLALRVTDVKTWFVMYGRGQAKSIGKYPVMTVDHARDEARRMLLEIAEHGAPLAVIEASKPAVSKSITLREFVEGDYKEWVQHELKRGQEAVDRILSVFTKLANTALPAIDRKAVEAVITARRRKGVETATTNRDLASIKAALSKAVEWGHLPAHPLGMMKASKITTGNVVRYLSADEEKRLRKSLAGREATRRASRERHNAWHDERGTEGHPQWPANGFTDHLTPLTLVAMNTGLRRGELFGLEWRNVNLPGKLLTVTADTAKSQKTRHIPLNAEALDVLTRWRKQSDGTGLVFPSAVGGKFDNIKKSWDGVTTDAKLDDFRFHDLRHDFASKLVMAGVDLNTVRELLGHSDIKMTLRYAHLAPHKLADAVAKLGVTK